MTRKVLVIMFVTITTVLLLSITACGNSTGGSNTASNPTESSGVTSQPTATVTSSNKSGVINLANGSMSCTMDGTVWNAKAITIATYSKETLSVSGADNSNPPRAIAFGVIASGPGTHKIEASINDTSSNAVLTIGGAAWQAVPLVRWNGTIVITTLTSTGASGTFSFNVDPVPGSSATGTKTITDGVFNVTFAK